MLNKENLENFWKKDFPPELKPLATKIESLSENELRTWEKVSGDKEFKSLKGSDALVKIAEKYISDGGKFLDRTYAVVFKVNSIAKLCPRCIEKILPVLFTLSKPGDFSYNCKVLFEDNNTLQDFMYIKEEVEKIASYDSYVNKVEFELNKGRY